MKNYNLKIKESYYYSVTVFLTTFEIINGKRESFEHTENFHHKNLLEAKKYAIEYFTERLEFVENGNFFLPFATPSEFILGQNCAFSVWLNFVISSDEGDLDYIILGDNDDVNQEGQEVEADVISQLELF